MRNIENDLLCKFEMIELKREVISILHSIQFDCCYHIEDCIVDLHKLLSTLDDMEMPQTNLMNLNKDKLTKEAIKHLLGEKNLITT